MANARWGLRLIRSTSSWQHAVGEWWYLRRFFVGACVVFAIVWRVSESVRLPQRPVPSSTHLAFKWTEITRPQAESAVLLRPPPWAGKASDEALQAPSSPEMAAAEQVTPAVWEVPPLPTGDPEHWPVSKNKESPRPSITLKHQ